jgi:hypothetical protein
LYGADAFEVTVIWAESSIVSFSPSMNCIFGKYIVCPSDRGFVVVVF